MSAKHSGSTEATTPPDWVAGLAAFLREEQEVEAVRVDPEARKVSFATLGEVDEARLQARLAEALAGLDVELARVRAEGIALPGGIRASSGDAGITLSKPSCPTAPLFWRWREASWPDAIAAARTDHEEDDHEHDEDEWKELAILAATCGVAGLAAFTAESLGLGPAWLPKALYVVALIAGGKEALEEAWPRLRRGVLDVHFLMLTVALGAVAIGAWGEGVLLLFLFSLSGALEHFAEARTHRELSALFAAQPPVARRIGTDGAEIEVPVDQVRPGDRLRVRPGDAFAVDAEIAEGRTSVDESALTGEAVPVDKDVGSSVSSGTINLQGSVVVIAQRAVQDSALQKIIRLVRDAQSRRAPSQRLTDRFGTSYTLLILGLTLGLFLFRWLVLGDAPFRSSPDAHSAFYRAMTLLVTASPCALVLSIPSAILAAIAWGARRGILFRGGAAIENLAGVRTVALDKTGTLTTGEMEVVAIESFPPGREGEVASIAVGIETHSSHPIARAIVAEGRRRAVSEADVADVENFPGFGLRGRLPSGNVVLGRRELLESQPLGTAIRDIPRPSFEEQEVWLVAPSLVGRILLRDRIRPEAAGMLRALEQRGIRTVMLTGDRRETAEAVGRELGLSDVRAGLRPEDKLKAIEALRADGPVAMIGDGVNDAPSLAAADIPVAMGARGADAALEQSAIVLMKDRLERFVDALALSEAARRVIRINLAVSLGTVVLASLAAVAGWIPLSVGVFAHEGSTVIVCLNSLRLLFLKPAATGAPVPR